MSNVVSFDARAKEKDAEDAKRDAYGDQSIKAFRILVRPIREMRDLGLSSEQIARILEVFVEELRGRGGDGPNQGPPAAS